MTSPLTVQSPRAKGDDDHRLRRQALSAEDVRNRSELLGPETVTPEIRPKGLGTEADLRRRLGLSAVIKTNVNSKLDVAEQLAEDEKTRDLLETDVLKLLESLRENSIQVQRSLENDAVRIDTVDDLITKNSADVRKEIERVDTLYRTTAMSCRANCALITTVLMIWIAVYIVMKITPRPS